MGPRRVRPIEALEDARLGFGRDTAATVADGERVAAFRALEIDPHGGARGCESHRVVEQVHDQPPDQLFVAGHGRRRDGSRLDRHFPG